MVARTQATQLQREFIARLQNVAIAVGAKGGSDDWSANLHGRVRLFEKNWGPKVQANKLETLLEVALEGLPEVQRSEPPVHLHVDWQALRSARTVEKHLPLIDTDWAIEFCRADGTVMFSLYCTRASLEAAKVELTKVFDFFPPGGAAPR